MRECCPNFGFALGMIPTLASVPFPARYNMHTKPWNLLALLFLLTPGGPYAFASEADELRAKAIAIQKEAAALAEAGPGAGPLVARVLRVP